MIKRVNFLELISNFSSNSNLNLYRTRNFVIVSIGVFWRYSLIVKEWICAVIWLLSLFFIKVYIRQKMMCRYNVYKFILKRLLILYLSLTNFFSSTDSLWRLIHTHLQDYPDHQAYLIRLPLQFDFGLMDGMEKIFLHLFDLALIWCRVYFN